ncbi:hypothetical protein Q3C01_25970 [Bradyrhizobium sp. UFLA05-109]
MSEGAADRFRWKAEECRKSAKHADDPIDKEAWLQLASEWRKLAEGAALRQGDWRALSDLANQLDMLIEDTEDKCPRVRDE